MSDKDPSRLGYSKSGVEDLEHEGVMAKLCSILRPTFDHRGDVLLDFGYFANVLKVSDNLGIAICTDGVGTKILLAEMAGRYDTVGIDCIAMNANDIVCVGARPTAMVDYIAVETASAELLHGIARGLARGAELAGISIPGGEIAQVREMIRGVREGHGFDLVGTCIGTVSLDRIIDGEGVEDGDVVIGIRSSGLHSNGFTLARRVLLDTAGYALDDHIPELGKTLGEELLTPTHIYVKPVMAVLDAGVDARALVHMTGDGALNLLRIRPIKEKRTSLGFEITHWPEPHAIFDLIQRRGNLPDEEMFRVYNMGLGFCLVVPEKDRGTTLDAITTHGFDASVVGVVRDGLDNSVLIPERNLKGKDGRFQGTT